MRCKLHPPKHACFIFHKWGGYAIPKTKNNHIYLNLSRILFFLENEWPSLITHIFENCVFSAGCQPQYPVEYLLVTETLSPPCDLHLPPRSQARYPVEYLQPRNYTDPGSVPLLRAVARVISLSLLSTLKSFSF